MQDIFQEVKSQLNIFNVCTTYGISPIKHSNNRFTCICPFHDDKSPSLTIYNDTNSFYCYGCSNGGDVIALIEKLFGISPIQAINKLNDDFNLSLNLPTKCDNLKIKKLIKKRDNERKVLLRFKEWEHSYMNYICNNIKAYSSLLELYKPKTLHDKISNDYVNTINRLQLLEYHFDILFNENTEHKLMLYKETGKGDYSGKKRNRTRAN